MFWIIGIGVTFLLLILGTSQGVKGAGIIFFILCGMEGSYFLLFWRNKRITMTRDDITYRSIWGKEKNTHGKTWDRCVISRLEEGRIEF